MSGISSGARPAFDYSPWERRPRAEDLGREVQRSAAVGELVEWLGL
jgi:hypothetical protein